MRVAVTLGVAAVASTAVGCGEDRTEVVVVADSNLSVPGEVDRITFDVTGPDGTVKQSTATLADTGLPATLGLVHDGGPTGPFVVVATAFRGDVDAVRRRARFSFQKGETLVLRMDLVRACIGVSCGSEQTCARGECRPVDVEPSELEPWTGRAERIDGGAPPPDAPVDAPADAPMDVGPDGCLATELCNEMDDDCDGVVDEGIDTDTDPSNCGECGNVCDLTNAEAACEGGSCIVDTCSVGFGDCNDDPADGCEVDTNASAEHCGECDNGCGASDVCVVGTCEVGVLGVAAGELHACALRSDGAVQCWGANGEGQLGTGSTGGTSLAVEVTGPSDATDIGAGGLASCAVRDGGVVSCWGDNGSGQLGDGSTAANRPSPGPVTGIASAVQVSVGGAFACAVADGGSVSCWGDNSAGQLGNGGGSGMESTPVDVSGLSDATMVSAGLEHACAVRSTGAISCWGANAEGQLGDGSETDRDIPVPVGGLTDAIAVAAGGQHTCAVRESGAVSCWGNNFRGQLGNGGGSDSSSPVDVGGVSSAIGIAAGEEHTCALLDDGAVQCWGRGQDGRLGHGSPSDSDTPVDVSDLVDATAVALGLGFSCAARSTAQVSCWGDNANGQLGDGTGSDQRTPVVVSGIP